MARTVDPAAHAARREEFLDVAQRLIQSKGYEQMSVQDVLAAVGSSKGAFYHYFDSKQALLEALIERTADQLAAHLAHEDDPGPALERLRRFFGALAGWKTGRQDLLVALLEVWYSDDNAVVRQKMRPRLAERIVPLLTEIVRAGIGEGAFDAVLPEQTSRVLISLINELNDAIGAVLIARPDDGVERLQALVAAYTQALERVLALQPGSITLVDPEAPRTWLGPSAH